jgi:hypothetical protein
MSPGDPIPSGPPGLPGKWGRSSLTDAAGGLTRHGDGKHTPDSRACQRHQTVAWAAESAESFAAAVLVAAESLVATVVESVAAAESDVSLEVATSLEVELEAAAPAVAADVLAEDV